MTEQPNTAPTWPSRVEAVEIARLDLKPGDKLVVKAKEGAPFTPSQSMELQEYFEYFLPGVSVIAVGLPLDLEVIEGAPGPEGGG